MLNLYWTKKIETDFKVYRSYNVLLYQYYLDAYGWINCYTNPVPAHFLSIEYYDYDIDDIVVYYNAKISGSNLVMVEGINYFKSHDSTWSYNHCSWEFL